MLKYSFSVCNWARLFSKSYAFQLRAATGTLLPKTMAGCAPASTPALIHLSFCTIDHGLHHPTQILSCLPGPNPSSWKWNLRSCKFWPKMTVSSCALYPNLTIPFPRTNWIHMLFTPFFPLPMCPCNLCCLQPAHTSLPNCSELHREHLSSMEGLGTTLTNLPLWRISPPQWHPSKLSYITHSS